MLHSFSVSAPNWFIGWPFSAAPALGPLPQRVRPLAPEDLHVTLAFLGRVEAAAAEAAWARAEALPLRTIDAGLGPVELMGAPRAPSAVAARLGEGREAVAEVMRAHRAELLALAGARPDARPPRPHVTVARVQRAASPQQRRLAAAWVEGLSLSTKARLDTLALYTWAEDRAARRFRVVRSRSLPPDLSA